MADQTGDVGGGTWMGQQMPATAAACLACSLITIGALGAIVGLLRAPRRRTRWPAAHLVPGPADFTPPHGDKLLRRR